MFEGKDGKLLLFLRLKKLMGFSFDDITGLFLLLVWFVWEEGEERREKREERREKREERREKREERREEKEKGEREKRGEREREKRVTTKKKKKKKTENAILLRGFDKQGKQTRPFDVIDLRVMGARVKHMGVVSHARGYIFKTRGSNVRYTNMERALILMEKAKENFEEVLDSNPNSSVSLRNCGQVFFFFFLFFFLFFFVFFCFYFIFVIFK